MSTIHINFKIGDAGFFIGCENPYIGASPDGIVKCSCCGDGVIEVKCPYCKRSELSEDNEKEFFLEFHDGVRSLKRNHSYYYQVQLQMLVCSLSYAEFVVWTEKDLFSERIFKDSSFVASHIPKVKQFFIYGVLPEIIGKWYTRIPVADEDGTVPFPESDLDDEDTVDSDEDPSKLWCYCNQPSSGEMIMCGSKKCNIKWFHFSCLGLTFTVSGFNMQCLVYPTSTFQFLITSCFLSFITTHILPASFPTLCMCISLVTRCITVVAHVSCWYPIWIGFIIGICWLS